LKEQSRRNNTLNKKTTKIGKNKAVILVIGILLIVTAVSSIIYTKSNSLKKLNILTIVTCTKENNCCKKEDDCKYIWFTGQCNTPEYITKVQKENEKRGLRQGEAPYRENVTCTCENNACLTH
jgi:hypothetical protein